MNKNSAIVELLLRNQIKQEQTNQPNIYSSRVECCLVLGFVKTDHNLIDSPNGKVGTHYILPCLDFWIMFRVKRSRYYMWSEVEENLITFIQDRLDDEVRFYIILTSLKIFYNNINIITESMTILRNMMLTLGLILAQKRWIDLIESDWLCTWVRNLINIDFEIIYKSKILHVPKCVWKPKQATNRVKKPRRK